MTKPEATDEELVGMIERGQLRLPETRLDPPPADPECCHSPRQGVTT